VASNVHRGGGRGRVSAGADVIVLPRMDLKSLLRLLDLPAQPRRPALTAILPSTLDHSRIFSHCGARELAAIETDLKATFFAADPYLTFGVAIPALAASLTDKPRVIPAKELHAFSELGVIELLYLVWHPVPIALCVYPFSQQSDKVSEPGVTTPTGTSSTIDTTVGDQLLLFHKILLAIIQIRLPCYSSYVCAQRKPTLNPA
jgi:hypothetical protein